MKGSKLREMSPEELRDEASAASEQLFKLRVQQATGQLENVRKIRQVKRDLARIETVLREKQLASTSAKAK